MSKLSYKILERKQKNQVRFYTILSVVLGILAVIYFLQNFDEYQEVKAYLEANENTITKVNTTAIKSKNSFDNKKNQFQTFSANIEEQINSIFPKTDDYTEITRQMDKYEKQLRNSESVFEISSLNYLSVQDEENYRIQPFTMNIRSSAENFSEFLHLIETSGGLNNQLRLMAVSSIKLNFDQNEEDEEDLIIFTVKINAYFQK